MIRDNFKYSFKYAHFVWMIALLTFPVFALAATTAITGYVSNSGTFQVKLPDNFEVETHDMRITSDMVLTAEKTTAVSDQRPYKDNVKRYIVQLEQTLGSALTQQDQTLLIDQALDKYIAHYASKNATLKSRNKQYFERMPGGEIYMTYNNDERGAQALRARVLYSDRSKITQIVTSSAETAFSLQSQEFFESMTLKNGVSKNEGNVIDDWVEHISPLGLFSVLLPAPVAPYIKNEPIIGGNEKTDYIGQVIFDPVRSEQILYKISGYKFGQLITPYAARHILETKHISRYLNSTGAVEFTQTQTPEGHSVIDAIFSTQSAKDNKKLDAIKLRATFANNDIVVQELKTSATLMQSRFVTNLLSHVIFHPETDAQKTDIDEDNTATPSD